MIIYRIISSNDSALRQLWEEWWILSCISEGKMYFWKEEKKARTIKVCTDDFEEFWNLYPKERRKMKKQAKEVWARLNEKTKTIAIEWLKKYKAYWKRTNQDMNFVPTAYYWLKWERYNDEWLDSPTTNPVVDKLQQEMEDERKHQAEKERIDKLVWQLRQDPVKWKQAYDKAKSEIPEAQLNLWPQIAERLIETRIRMQLTK